MRSDWSRWLCALLLALLSIPLATGCARSTNSGAGSLEPSRAYWGALSGGKLPAYAQDALRIEGAATLSRAQLLKLRACSQLGIAALNEQQKRIATLQGQDVDAEVLRYAAELASTNAAMLAVLSELRSVLDGPPSARVPSEKLDAFRALQAKLVASELAVRAHLVARFGQEFAPQTALSMAGAPSSKEIDAQRMKFDLIGREIEGWEFETLEEFVTFEIRNSRTDTQVAVFAVFTQVRGASSGTTRGIGLNIGYKVGPHGWELMRVSPN